MNDAGQAKKNEFSSKNFGLEYKDSGNFIRCQWQRDSRPSVTYLIYRCAVAVYFLVTLFLCMFNVGRKREFSHSPSKWPIFLTNWGYVMNTLQACLGSALLLHGFVNERTGEYATLKKEPATNWCFQLYWVIHTIAVVIAFSITGSFWVAVYDPALHQFDMVSIISHVFNSLAMGIDLLIVSHPIRLQHVYWPVGWLTSYFAFSLVYFWLGGTDVHNKTMIYNILDWQRPVRTGVICSMALTYTALTHVVTWALYMCRRWVGRRFIQRQLPVATETVIVNTYV